MNKKISVLLYLSLLLCSTAHAVNPIIPHSVIPTVSNLQKMPIDIGLNSQYSTINNMANLKSINSYDRWRRNGTASLQKITDVSSYVDLYTSQFDDYVDGKTNTFLDNTLGQVSSATGINAPNISANMLTNPAQLQNAIEKSAINQTKGIANDNLAEIQKTAETLTGLNSPNLTVNSLSNPDRLTNSALSGIERQASDAVDNTVQDLLGTGASAAGINAPNVSANMLTNPAQIQNATEKSAINQTKGFANDNLKEIQKTAETLTGLNSPNLTVNSLSDPNKLANRLVAEAEDKTEDEIQDILNDITDYLTDELIDKIKKSMDKKESDKRPQELDQIGITGDTLETPKQNTSLGADGNRSDTFGGTGNGSSAQAEQSKQAFEKVNQNVSETMQYPSDLEKAQKMTPAQLAQISQLQNETVKEMASRGLAKAWIRQAVVTGQLEKQEETFTDLFNQNASDIRKVIQLVSFISLATVESQNNANAIIAPELSITAAKTVHEGITAQAYLPASANQER